MWTQLSAPQGGNCPQAEAGALGADLVTFLRDCTLAPPVGQCLKSSHLLWFVQFCLQWEGGLVLYKVPHHNWSFPISWITLHQTLMLSTFQSLKSLPPFLFLPLPSPSPHWSCFCKSPVTSLFPGWVFLPSSLSLTSWWCVKRLASVSFLKLFSLGFSPLWLCFCLWLLLLCFICWSQFLRHLITGIPRTVPQGAHLFLSIHRFMYLISFLAFHSLICAYDCSFVWPILSSPKLLPELSSYLIDIFIWILHLRIDLAAVSFLTLSYTLHFFDYCTPSTLTKAHPTLSHFRGFACAVLTSWVTLPSVFASLSSHPKVSISP